jgi:hypothetical protein
MTMPVALPAPRALHPSLVPVLPEADAAIEGSMLPCGCHIPVWASHDAVLCAKHEAELQARMVRDD